MLPLRAANRPLINLTFSGKFVPQTPKLQCWIFMGLKSKDFEPGRQYWQPVLIRRSRCESCNMSLSAPGFLFLSWRLCCGKWSTWRPDRRRPSLKLQCRSTPPGGSCGSTWPTWSWPRGDTTRLVKIRVEAVKTRRYRIINNYQLIHSYQPDVSLSTLASVFGGMEFGKETHQPLSPHRKTPAGLEFKSRTFWLWQC